MEIIKFQKVRTFSGKSALAQREEAFERWPGEYRREAAKTAALTNRAGNQVMRNPSKHFVIDVLNTDNHLVIMTNV